MSRAVRKEFTATFHRATREMSSLNGNPTWTLHTSAGSYRTETDGQVGYEVSNYTGGPDSLIGREVTFKVVGVRERVYDMSAADDAGEGGETR